MENELLTELEQKIGYQFKDKGLLKHAMSHSSYANERHMGKLKSNERDQTIWTWNIVCGTIPINPSYSRSSWNIWNIQFPLPRCCFNRQFLFW